MEKRFTGVTFCQGQGGDEKERGDQQHKCLGAEPKMNGQGNIFDHQTGEIKDRRKKHQGLDKLMGRLGRGKGEVRPQKNGKVLTAQKEKRYLFSQSSFMWKEEKRTTKQGRNGLI